MGFAEDMRQAEENFMAAKAVYSAAVSAASASISQTEKEYRRRICRVEASLTSSKTLDHYKGISVYSDRIVHSGTVLKLTTDVRVTVESRGGIYPAGRSGIRKDLRKLFIVVESPEGSILVKCNPNDEERARSFAARLRGLLSQGSETLAAKHTELARLQSELAIAQADTGAIHAAQYHYQVVCSDTAAVRAAEQALAALRASASQAEVAAYENSKRQTRNRDRVLAIVAGIVVVAAVAAVMVFAFGKVG